MNLSVADKLLIQQYFAKIPVIRAYLFGSMARNQGSRESDIDILVELDHSKPIGMKFFLFQSDLEELLHKKVDLIASEGLSRHVKSFIDKDKVLIYERNII